MKNTKRRESEYMGEGPTKVAVLLKQYRTTCCFSIFSLLKASLPKLPLVVAINPRMLRNRLG